MASCASKRELSGSYFTGLICAGAGFFLLWVVQLFGQSAVSGYLIFLGASVAAAAISRFRAGAITLILGFFAAQWFLPERHFVFHLSTLSDWLGALGYWIIGCALIFFLAGRQRHKAGPSAGRIETEEFPAGSARKVFQSNGAPEIDAFVYSVSHDLRTPMRAIKGFTIAIREDYGHLMNAEGMEYARRTVEATERLEKMLDCLLNYSRIGRGEIELSRIELRDVLKKISAEWPTAAGDGKAKLEIIEPLPTVLAEPRLLEESLKQLLSNAFKFVAPGRNAHVKIHSEEANGVVHIKITDNGIGIEEKHFPKLFGVFQRFNPSEQYAGMGIGLACAQKAVTKMGGKVGAQSTAGEGSCFWIELPKARMEPKSKR